VKPTRSSARRAFALALLLAACPVRAQGSAAPEDHWPVPAYAPVVDETGALDLDSRTALQRIIGATEAETGTRLAVLVVRSVEGVSPERLAERVYRAWRLGSAWRDDGLLLVYAVEDRWWQLWWGPALDPRMDDPARLAPAQRVLADTGDGPPGQRLVQATALLARAVGASAEAVAQPYEMRRDWGRLVVPLVLLAGSAVVALIVWLQIKGNKAWSRWLQRRVAAGLERTLLRVEVEGPRLQVRSRHALLLAVGPLVFFPMMLNGPLTEGVRRWSRGVEGFWCSHEAAGCVVQANGRTTYRIPLQEIDHFEAFGHFEGFGAQGDEAVLLAVTRRGNVPLLRGWPVAHVGGLAARLDAFLADPAALPVSREHDFAGRAPAVMVEVGALLLALALAIFWPRRLVVDLAARQVELRWPLRAWVRPLGAIRAVRVWSALQEQVETARRLRKPMPYTRLPAGQARLVLVDAEGKRLPATVHLGTLLSVGLPGGVEVQAWPRLEAVARQLAAFMGVPYLEPAEVPPGGIVPPPLDEGPEGSRTPAITPT